MIKRHVEKWHKVVKTAGINAGNRFLRSAQRYFNALARRGFGSEPWQRSRLERDGHTRGDCGNDFLQAVLEPRISDTEDFAAVATGRAPAVQRGIRHMEGSSSPRSRRSGQVHVGSRACTFAAPRDLV